MSPSTAGELSNHIKTSKAHTRKTSISSSHRTIAKRIASTWCRGYCCAQYKSAVNILFKAKPLPWPRRSQWLTSKRPRTYVTLKLAARAACDSIVCKKIQSYSGEKHMSRQVFAASLHDETKECSCICRFLNLPSAVNLTDASGWLVSMTLCQWMPCKTCTSRHSHALKALK